MFTALHAVILGLVEGITEFLPISSTGHMILAANALRITDVDFLKSFEIIIQLGAILAVFLLYWKKLLLNGKIFKRVAVAFVPTAIIALIFIKTVESLLGNTQVVLWSLAVGGALLIIFEFFHHEKEDRHATTTLELESITYVQAFIIGIFQSIAIIPGVSRSAATIVGGLLLGISRRTIVEFSFMLAIPTMAGATAVSIYNIIKSGNSFTGHQMGLLSIGFIVAFISALFAVRFLLRFLTSHTFTPFGVYRIAIAAAFLLYLV